MPGLALVLDIHLHHRCVPDRIENRPGQPVVVRQVSGGFAHRESIETAPGKSISRLGIESADSADYADCRMDERSDPANEVILRAERYCVFFATDYTDYTDSGFGCSHRQTQMNTDQEGCSYRLTAIGYLFTLPRRHPKYTPSLSSGLCTGRFPPTADRSDPADCRPEDPILRALVPWW